MVWSRAGKTTLLLSINLVIMIRLKAVLVDPEEVPSTFKGFQIKQKISMLKFSFPSFSRLSSFVRSN